MTKRQAFYYALSFSLLILSNSAKAQWTEKNNGLYGGYVYGFAASGSNLFAGLHGGAKSGLVGGGVYTSTNNGTSWTAINNGMTSNNVNCLAVSGPNLFAGINDGIFLSSDNGANWVAVNTGLSTPILWHVNSIVISGPNIFAATGGGGVFISSNNGTTWTAINSGMRTGNVTTLVIKGTKLFAGTNAGVFVSANNGSSWSAVNTGLTIANYIVALAVNGTNIFAGGSQGGVYLSTNDGADWSAVNSGLSNTHLRSLASDGTNLYARTLTGVFLSTIHGDLNNTA